MKLADITGSIIAKAVKFVDEVKTKVNENIQAAKEAESIEKSVEAKKPVEAKSAEKPAEAAKKAEDDK